MAEIWGAAIAAAGVIGGAVISNQGAKKAASAAGQGSDAAAAEAARQFDTIRGDHLGRINIGNQAINSLGAMYGYSPTQGSPYQGNAMTAGAQPYTPQMPGASGFGNTGVSAALNPYTVTSKLGSAGKWLDPAGGLLGNLFGGGHGDEKRNLKAFGAESGVMQLPDGRLMLPDGSTFSESQLQDVAGTWYGAVHAPDGNQQDWQNRYTQLLGGLQKTPLPNAGGGLTSDGVPGSMQTGQGGNALAAPDYSAFFKSPDYEFRRSEGTRDIGNSFSAGGGAKSGNALKALAEWNQNVAKTGFNDYFQNQLALAGQGQGASNASGNAGIATGQIVGNALQNSANARASGVAGQYNAIGAGLSGLAQGVGYWNANRNGLSGYGTQANNWGLQRPYGSYA